MDDRNVRVVNLTGHPLDLFDGIHLITIRASNKKARVSSNQQMEERVWIGNGRKGVTLPVLRLTEHHVMELPEPQEGVLYVVSGIVAAHANREDVVAPSRVESVENKHKVARALARIGTKVQ